MTNQDRNNALDDVIKKHGNAINQAGNSLYQAGVKFDRHTNEIGPPLDTPNKPNQQDNTGNSQKGRTLAQEHINHQR